MTSYTATCVCACPPWPCTSGHIWLTDWHSCHASLSVGTHTLHPWSMVYDSMFFDLWSMIPYSLVFHPSDCSLSLGTDTLHVLWSMINGLWFHLTGSLSLPWSMVPHPSDSISLGTDYLHPYSIVLDSCDWWISDFYDYHVSLSGSKGTDTFHPWSMN